MFAPAYVLLPVSRTNPAEALRLSLAPFERGGRGDLPDERLAFHDETEYVRELHRATFTFTKEERGGTRIEGGVETWHLDFDAVRQEMAVRGLGRWAVRFADLEPDVDAFAARFVRGLERHPVTGGYGRYLNPLGRWDWWDLGGRFDGRIQGERHRAGATASVVSSGPSDGRMVLSNVASVLSGVLGSDKPPDFVAEADANVELVSRLLDDLRAGCEHAVPTSVILPPGSCEDRLRWVGTWPTFGPEEILDLLELPPQTGWREVLTSVYERHSDHWAANVAYHF